MALNLTELTSKIKSILASSGISDPISEVVLNDSGLHGENFASQTKYVTVKFEDSDSGKKQKLELFVKILPSDPDQVRTVQELQLFRKEAVFFMEYLPMAGEYCKRLGQETLMDNYPKCYYADDELLVFENLVLERDFTLLNKADKQDFETAKLVVTNLAKHHVMSHAMVEELGGADLFFERFPLLKFEILMKDVASKSFSSHWDNTIDTAVKILGKCETVEAKEVAEKFMSLKGKQFGQVLESLKASPGDFLVLNHGDYWNNNMMFLKDNESGYVKQHISIDFQEVRYGSPCLDLGNYLFTSVKPEVRRGRFKDLLKIYFDALKVTGNKLGHPVGISLEGLEIDFCNHFHLGFWQGLSVVTGAGYAVLKEMQETEGNDDSDWPTRFNKLMEKWLQEHPEECANNVESIIQYWKEYERFSSGRSIQSN